MIFPKKINKSNLFYVIIIFIILVSSVRYFKQQERYHYEEPIIAKLKFDCSKLDDRIKNVDFYPADESYTEDKKRIYLCLRDENDKYYDYNMLMYVAIHECAHALTDVIDPEHKTNEFKTTFQNLLQIAEQLGLYDPSKEIIENYCKVKRKKH